MLIGQSRIDITPYIDISMYGHGEDRFTGLKDRLYATSIIFSKKRTKVCLITADLVGFDKSFTNIVQGEISRQLKISKKNIILCATHTHTGPDVRWPLKAKNNIRYIKELKKKLVNVARKANEALIESSIGAGVGKVAIGINRRLKIKNIMQFAPNPNGIYDGNVTVVKISGFGKLKGLITNHACHPTSQGGKVISADYPGRVRDLLGRKYGSKIIISFMLGCCGDARPNGIYKKGQWTALTNKQLLEFKKNVVRVIQNIKEEQDPGLSFIHSKVELPLDTNRFKLGDLKKQYTDQVRFIKKEGITKKNPKGKHVYLRILKSLAEAIKIRENKQKINPVPLDIALLKVGKIIFVFLPGELFTEIGLQIKKLGKNCIIIPVTLYNISVPYICTEKACKEGGYEPNEAFLRFGGLYPFPFSGRCEKIIVRKVFNLLKNHD